MAWFSNNKDRANEHSQEQSVFLNDPGLPDSDLTQLGYQLFKDCGCTYIVFGKSNISDCFNALSSVAPVFLNTKVTNIGLGIINGQENSGWVGFESNEGSVIAYFVFPEDDSDFSITQIAMRLKNLPTLWQFKIGTVNASVPFEVARIMCNAKAVPVWDMPGFDSYRPVDSSMTTFPDLLRQQILDTGATLINENLFRVTLGITDTRTQVLLLSAWTNNSFAFLSPIADSLDGSIPESLRGRDFGKYTLDVVENRVYLVDFLPAGPPSPTMQEIMDCGLNLAHFADKIESEISLEDNY